jgi:hypothetical protein
MIMAGRTITTISMERVTAPSPSIAPLEFSPHLGSKNYTWSADLPAFRTDAPTSASPREARRVSATP